MEKENKGKIISITRLGIMKRAIFLCFVLLFIVCVFFDCKIIPLSRNKCICAKD